MLFPATTAILFLHLLLCCRHTHGHSQNTGFQHTDLKDRLFQEGQLFTTPGVPSVVACAGLCSDLVQCITFTFTPSGSQDGSGSCRGHDVIVTSQSLSTSAKEAMTYRRIIDKDELVENEPAVHDPRSDDPVDWPKCQSDEDCTTLRTVCFRGRCLCVPGYYFSVSSHSCVDNCEDKDLQASFMTYVEGRVVAQGYIKGSLVDRGQDCRSQCLELSICSAFVLSNVLYCSLFGLDTLPFPADDWDANITGSIYSQRLCA